MGHVTFANQLLKKLGQISNLPRQDFQEAQKFANQHFFWEVATTLGLFYNREKVSDMVRNDCRDIIDQIREYQGQIALSSTSPTTIVLGTSGWRGVIGADYSLFNITKVLRAVVFLLKSDVYLEYNGYKSFADVQQRGILLMRDNRFMGDIWLAAAERELTSVGVRVYNTGMCPTGVGSAYVKDRSLAGSINFTPSHNPMPYAGIKFNPSDGGGAENNLSSIIEDKANELMHDASFRAIETADESLIEKVDAGAYFKNYIEQKSLVFDLPAIRQWLRTNRHDFFLVIDFMHGASRGYVQQLLGDETWKALEDAGSILTRHEDDDFSFHGTKPEPSEANQKPLLKILKQNRRRFCLGVAMDPDADRIRYADADMDVDMNRFSAIAYANLLERGIKGGLVNSVPSSGFAAKIARENGQKAIETQVGFKNFRSAFLSGDFAMGFEESDGISFIGHTLEKCALAGFMAALTVISSKDKNISVQYNTLQERYGYFYPDRAGVDVRGVSVEAWQAYKSVVVKILQNELFKAGDTIEIGNITHTITRINTIDGLKIIMDDDSWILLRPSGTEPKFRYYYEVVSATPLDDPASLLDQYRDKAEALLAEARRRADAGA